MIIRRRAIYLRHGRAGRVYEALEGDKNPDVPLQFFDRLPTPLSQINSPDAILIQCDGGSATLRRDEGDIFVSTIERSYGTASLSTSFALDIALLFGACSLSTFALALEQFSHLLA